MKELNLRVLIVFLLLITALALVFIVDGRLREEEAGKDRVFCTAEQRNAEACIEIYQPVCGHFDPDKIKCIREPCAQTFGNSCFACMNREVLFWEEGECAL